MAYRIFYSYQSDIPKKLNQVFIRDAISAAIKKITQHKIEVLIEGFYGIGGNPPLAEAMLKQSKESDIFIGDVTFTSSRIWQSKCSEFSEDAKTYLIEIEKPVDLKPAPNPNVLLETGYSWALKSFNRTILVMNEAFGKPSKLPVDMKGLRWPITYNLSEERFTKNAKFKKEFEQLRNALESAIIDAIKSSIEYQTEKWEPFRLNAQLKKRHSYPYKMTSALELKLKELRKRLLNYRSPIRLGGAQGSGKSRMAHELFNQNGDIDEHEYNTNVLYYDLGGTAFTDISKQIVSLTSLNQLKIVVLDNCERKIHDRLSEELKNTNIRLLTIKPNHDGSSTDFPDIIIEKDISISVNEEIITERFQGINVDFLIENTKGNLNITIPVLESQLKEEDINKGVVEMTKAIIGQPNLEKGALTFLGLLNVMKHIGVANSYNYQLKIIREAFMPEISEDNVEEIIEGLMTLNLIYKQGDFVVAKYENQQIVDNWWENNKIHIDKIITKISDERILIRFLDRILLVLDEEQIDELAEVLFNIDGLMRDKDFLEKNNSNIVLDKFVVDYPEKVADIMFVKLDTELK